MGDFRMTIEAVGGHGCDRKAKEGDEVQGCGGETCPDCLFARFVSELQRAGMRPYTATMHHWPADLKAPHIISHSYTPEREVVDDYTERDVKYPTGAFRRATGKRVKGSF
jgi:hypothetical protein